MERDIKLKFSCAYQLGANRAYHRYLETGAERHAVRAARRADKARDFYYMKGKAYNMKLTSEQTKTARIPIATTEAIKVQLEIRARRERRSLNDFVNILFSDFLGLADTERPPRSCSRGAR